MTVTVNLHLIQHQLTLSGLVSMMRTNGKAMPINDNDYSCCNSYRTCLTNHMRSTSCHIMPLVINSLRHGHTHTQTHISTICAGSTLRNQVCVPVCGWRVPGLKSQRNKVEICTYQHWPIYLANGQLPSYLGTTQISIKSTVFIPTLASSVSHRKSRRFCISHHYVAMVVLMHF